MSELESILNYLETTSMEPHDDYTSEFSYKEQKVLWKYIKQLQQENQELKKQIEYLKGGEYLNQLKFERNMLQDVVDKMEVSKEDKKFIDMTHRNTELLEENRELKKQLEKKDNLVDKAIHVSLNQKSTIENYKYKIDVLKTQQKEFIEWLEKESKELIRDAGYHQRICLEILEKYNEIIGGTDE